ncbi:MAG: ATP-binding cassette domain-containing protein [Helicobacteraceae bacterium]|jgi:putative ABC transport system ATP-binding protein|nr:ATP-binding cassette domain-containing protein [Helicobacteraceae bacterium]
MLEAHELSLAFERPLFSHVNIDIAAGASAAVVGVSGSGKSTLLHILSTFLPPQEGRVKLCGVDIYAISQTDRERLRKEAVGMIFQQHYLFRGFTARENLKVASLLSGYDIDERLMERLGIAHLLDQDAMNLSGGQQQRLSIARVLTKKPKFIYADEPTGNLDQANALEAIGILLEYVRENGAVLFLATHDESIARKADRIFKLENGSLFLLQ